MITCVVTWSRESFPSSATILLRLATEPNRGTASPTRRYLWPLLLNTSVTHSGLPAKTESGAAGEMTASALMSYCRLIFRTERTMEEFHE